MNILLCVNVRWDPARARVPLRGGLLCFVHRSHFAMFCVFSYVIWAYPDLAFTCTHYQRGGERGSCTGGRKCFMIKFRLTASSFFLHFFPTYLPTYTITLIHTYVHVPSSILLFFCRLGDERTATISDHEGRFTYRDQKFSVFVFRAFVLSCFILFYLFRYIRMSPCFPAASEVFL